jgi:hypothetical protein
LFLLPRQRHEREPVTPRQIEQDNVLYVRLSRGRGPANGIGALSGTRLGCNV